MSSKKDLQSIPAIQTVPYDRELRFRQTRFENEDRLLKLFISGVEYKILNWSRIGVGFSSDETVRRFDPGALIENAEIKMDSQILYAGKLEIRNIKKADEGLLYGAVFKSNLFLAEGIETALEGRRVRLRVSEFQEQLDKIEPKVFELVLRMRTFLGDLKNTCDAVEQSLVKMPMDRRAEAERSFLETTSEFATALIKDFNKRVSEAIDIDKIPENSIYHQLFEREIFPFFESGEIAWRAKEKPRGYAGDYEMMNQIYRNGFEGKDLLGKLIHNYIINEDSSNSVKFRKPFFTSYYEELKKAGKESFVLSVACGPAAEVQDLVATWPQDALEKLHITLFDLDRTALEHAQNMIFENSLKYSKDPKIQFINASVKSFLTQNARVDGKYDLIYSGGLFDYLDNATSKALTERLFEVLRPGGRLIIGNFTKNNTTKAFCHLITQWHLIHKSEDEILGWASNLKGASSDLRFDPQRINAFLEVTRHR